MESTVVVKSFRLLEAIAANPSATLGTLSLHLQMAKPTVHRVLGDLISLGYVQRDASGTYLPAPGLWRLMPGAQARLLSASDPVMNKLWRKTRETVNLGELSGQYVRYLKVLNSEFPLRRDVQADDLDPAVTTAIGRAIIAALPGREQAPFLTQTHARQKTRISRRALKSALQETLLQGYAVDQGETDAGVICIASVVTDGSGARAALSLSLPLARLEQHGGKTALAKHVLAASAAISKRLGRLEQFPTPPIKVKENDCA